MKKFRIRPYCIVLIFFTLTLIYIMPTNVLAEEDNSTATIHNAINHQNSLKVVDKNNNDITEQFIKIYNEYGIDQAKEYFYSSEGKLSFRETEDINNSITPYAITRVKTITDTITYAPRCAENSTIAAGWTTKITGSFTYNIATDEILRATSPTISLYNVECGILVSMSLDNIRTWTSINKNTNRATFYASHDMTAVVGTDIEGFPINTNLDFGHHTDSIVGGS